MSLLTKKRVRKVVEEEHCALIDALPQFVWIIRPDGSIAYTNQRWRDYRRLLSQRAEEQTECQHPPFDGCPPVQDKQPMLPHADSCPEKEIWLQNLHPEDKERVLELQRQTLATDESYEFEYRLRDGRTGEYRWFLSQHVPLLNEAGQIVQWLATCTDIEEQKRAEQQLKESQENWQLLAETVPQFVWTTTPDNSATYCNQHYLDYVGASPEDVLGSGWQHFVHPDDLERTLAVRQHSLETGSPYEIEYRIKDSETGRYHWFLVRALPVRDDASQIVKWFGTCTDIDEQKRTEEALRQSQETAGALGNSNITGIYISEGEQIVNAKDTFLRMTGYTREDLREGRMSWWHLTPPEGLARTLEAGQELATRQSLTPYEKEYVCQDGSRLPVLVGKVVLPHSPPQRIAFVLDNSARKELEQRYCQLKKFR
ncbi:hypothetical protein KSB_92240 [Ktedonobacter robiniae]|uniref:histidine kinase n=1 Tax=Ktedonobacter robiniae TaxID=2778365 RepID=A0ABQ3V6A6_9CHLR|nr:hypothetical protein KSB_92240 [Ktedonobacter robiniae]